MKFYIINSVVIVALLWESEGREGERRREERRGGEGRGGQGKEKNGVMSLSGKRKWGFLHRSPLGSQPSSKRPADSG